MIIEKREQPYTIDLTGPAGNVFVLISQAKKIAKILGWEDEGTALIEDMMSSDYEHAVKAFDDAFGEFVILEK